MIGILHKASASEIPEVNADGEEAKNMDVFYDPSRKCYWIQNARGGWIEVNETSLSRQLIPCGFSRARNSGGLSPLEQELNDIQTEHDIFYAGPLAGHFAGFLEDHETRILVTSSPKLIEPVPGEFPIFRQFIENLLTDDAGDQLSHFYGWVKTGFECLWERNLRSGQALVLAGKRGCGKSLLQKVLTLIFGNRDARPARYMKEGTNFNGELIGAEHLIIEDDCASTKIAARLAFGDHIKAVTSNELQSCHMKGRQAVGLRPCWRMSISLNDEAENLMILPPMDDHLLDKIILLRAHKKPMPMPTTSMAERALFWSTLESELPAFLYWLTTIWEIPKELGSERFGIKEFQNPDLMAALNDLSPEARLLRLIDAALFEPRKRGVGPVDPRERAWTGTAEKIEEMLIDSGYEKEVGKLLTWPGAAGTYLARLKNSRPDRVTKKRSAQERSWTLHPPVMTP